MKAMINGNHLAYDDFGCGPAIVLIHGFPLNRQMWTRQVDPLVNAGYRVIMPDLRGFGDSSASNTSWTLQSMAGDVLSLLNYLGIGRAVFCGAGMGGTVVLHLLERSSHRVAGACLVSTPVQGADQAEKTRCNELIWMAEAAHLNELVEEHLGTLFGRGEAIIPDDKALISGMIWSTDYAALVNGLRAVRDRKDFGATIRLLDTPCLFVKGGSDPSRLLSSSLSGSTEVEIEGAGSLVNYEKTEAFNGCLLEFIGQVRARRHGPARLSKVA